MGNEKRNDQATLPTHIQSIFGLDQPDCSFTDIEVLETHISWVVLHGDYAFKFKKPVNFSFLNFSTLERRKHFCEQELLLNRNFSLALYLCVLPVTCSGETYQFSGEGDIVDYCLKMVRFNQSDLFDERVNQETFEATWMDMLASDVASFHGEARVEQGPSFSHGQYLSDHIKENLSVIHEYSSIRSMETYAVEELAAKAGLLYQRQVGGYVRQCHGDLHLKNISLFKGHPVAFDCIEFSDAFSVIDVLNDVAFLVMDCDVRNRSDLGYRFLSRYLEQTEDYGGLELFKLYLFYRATVRAKVAALTAGKDASESHEQVFQYLHLAETYINRTSPKLFAVGGLSGSGKSHLALKGCGVEHAIILRTDFIRKQIISDASDIELYGDEMNARTYENMFSQADTILRAGFSVILDATFLDKKFRDKFWQLANKTSVSSMFYWLNMDVDMLKARVYERSITKNDVSDADLEVLEKQLENYQRPEFPENVIHLSSSNHWPRN